MWGCNQRWVQDRCRDGIIPLAELVKGKWSIPSEAEKPPCTGLFAVLLMENIIEKNRGFNVSVFPPRHKKKGKESAHYLASWGFISAIACEEDTDDMFSGVTVLNRGKQLIRKLREIPKEIRAISNTIDAGIDLKHAHLAVKRSIKKKIS